MKLNKSTRWMILFAALCVSGACKKNYITGGTPDNVNAYKNMSTYDVLSGIPLYDTLVQLIDAAGIKDKINQPGTSFFAPSDYSIFQYLNLRTISLQASYDSLSFPLDSLIYYLKNNVNGTADSLLMYLVPATLPYDSLTNMGAYYPTGLAGDTVIISYEATTNSELGYSSLVSGIPRVVYYTFLWHPYPLSSSNPVGLITPDIGVHTICKTSGVMTQNGTLFALDNSHTLFFYGTNQ